MVYRAVGFEFSFCQSIHLNSIKLGFSVCRAENQTLYHGELAHILSPGALEN